MKQEGLVFEKKEKKNQEANWIIGFQAISIHYYSK